MLSSGAAKYLDDNNSTLITGSLLKNTIQYVQSKSYWHHWAQIHLSTWHCALPTSACLSCMLKTKKLYHFHVNKN